MTNILLKTFSEDDFELLNNWITTNEDLMQFAGSALVFPLTKKQFFEDLKHENRYAFSVFKNEKLIGHAQILEKENSFLLGRILIGEKQNRGQGYGEIIVEKLLDFGFKKFKNKTAELNVFDWNISAIKCYEKIGFRINHDLKKEVQINNKIWTSVNMTMGKLSDLLIS
ncbi:Protein N-acetyltransferase, RimJ/RimL family [Soonwooa buanensis]|uniref:Protein N-acetyltransferase, RimJ/RimL family n=1 Tax=Soonwooa buanensis TaxID=619805 RepID=A0A1T5D3A0_9FLAO|nr:GNAT family protein [Soonwooa buanensis]SKB66172.1 Protein N-acetyltransferase, RimJ/RimL family [Soonwooa buanensis]